MPPSPARPGYINPSSPQSAGGLSLSFYAAAQSHPVSSPTVGVSNFDTNLHNIQREYTSAFEHGLTCPQNLTQLLVWLAKMLKSMYVECGLHIVERPCLNAYLRVFHLRVIVLIGAFNKNSLNIVNINVDRCQYWRPLPTVQWARWCRCLNPSLRQIYHRGFRAQPSGRLVAVTSLIRAALDADSLGNQY